MAQECSRWRGIVEALIEDLNDVAEEAENRKKMRGNVGEKSSHFRLPLGIVKWMVVHSLGKIKV